VSTPRTPALDLAAVHIGDERAVRLDQDVERLTRYITPSLTERLFGDPDVNDFQINSDTWIWIDRHSAGRVHEGDFMPSERLEMFINAVAEHLGTVLDAQNDVLEGELPGPVFGGSRFTAFGPPRASPPAIVVRKRATKIYTLDYRNNEIASQAQVDVLEQAILAGLNVVVCGAMRSGKTTFLTGCSLRWLSSGRVTAPSWWRTRRSCNPRFRTRRGSSPGGRRASGSSSVP
jgi:Flp pilus assembly CpaF family ATPase